jgi:hypothetical protein
MSRENLILITLCGLLTTSCAVIKNTSPGQVTKIENGDFKKLNGEFPNYPTSSTGTIINDMVSNDFEPQTLWSQLDGFKQGGTLETFRQQTVTIDFLSDKKGLAKLWDNGEVRKTKTIRGKIRDGYFYRRPYFFAVPLIPLIFGYKTYRYRIGINGDSIVVDYRWNFWAFAIASGNYSHGQSNSIFEKK